MSNNYADRPPRIQPQLPQQEIEIPPPPEKNAGTRQSLLEILLPLVTIGGYIFMAATGQGRSIALIIPMGLAMLGSVYLSLRRASEAEKEIEIKKEAYAKRLLDLRHELRNYHQLQRDFYYYNYPDPITADKIARQEEQSRSGPRLWERRTSDQDFGAIRLGIGTRASTVRYTISIKDNDEDPQMDDAIRLSEDSMYVSDVPITLQLRYVPVAKDDETAPDIQHSLGIYSISTAAPDAPHHIKYNEIYAYIRALLIHYTAFHSPLDTRVYVVGTEASKIEWEWAMQLPHSRVGQNETLLCFEGEQAKVRDELVPRVPLFLKDINNTLQTRAQRLGDKDSGDVTLPFLLLVVDMLGMQPGTTMWDIESDQAISTILQQGPMLGAAVIFLCGDARKIPSDARGVIELERLDKESVAFRYAEIGVNSPRYVGIADMVTRQQEALGFAQQLQQYQVRASAAASLVSAIDLLQMNEVIDIDELEILKRWEESRRPDKAEWPRVKLGAKSASDVRELVFEANADGVHAMVAGTTGSGKSELLQTMILGLAIRYDPSIVNFVLVDFKGGGAFDPFRTLPHVVDVVTNLEGSAVERMFSAIKAELDRRGAVNAKNRVAHIVEYRKEGYHLQPAEEGKGPFPHLFIFIDEFAEMVAENPEFKSQFDSITRLGRAIGVSLILATQRPAGMVTDQMRANIKMKICLRVETPDDSRELLRRSDAAYLPPSIPGRAYVQIGNELPEMVQVAYSGGTYRRAQKAQEEAVIWLTRPKRKASKEERKPEKVFQALTREMQRYAREKPDEIIIQRKPWPNPLPKYMPLGVPLDKLDVVDTEYLIPEDRIWLNGGKKPEKGTDLYLNRDVAAWQTGNGKWEPLDWASPRTLTAVVGLMDNPRAAEQRLYTIDLKKSNPVVFSASGWGKSTFLRTLITSLSATHSPDDLWIYILDFGGLSLDVFKNMPHVGAVITPEEDERINRLLRTLLLEVEDRKRKVADKNVPDLMAYNALPDTETIPAILVVVDNWAEIRENFEHLIPVFTSLLREGRTVGVFFAASADVPGSLGGKIFNMFTERIALKLADKSEYPNIVGRGGASISDLWGRGLVAVERTISQNPLEVQIASPVALHQDELVYDQSDQGFVDENNDGIDDVTGQPIVRLIDENETLNKLGQVIVDRLGEMVETMKQAWAGGQPRSIDILKTYVYYGDIVQETTKPEGDMAHALIGIEDNELKPFWIHLRGNPNFIVIGPPLSGRTTFLQTWMLSLAENYSPQEVAIIIVDPMQAFANYLGGNRTLDELPHVLAYVYDEETLNDLIEKLSYEFNAERRPGDPQKPREFFIFVDNFDDFDDLIGGRGRDHYKRLAQLVRDFRSSSELHFILGGSEDVARRTDDLKKQVEKTRYGFALKTERAVESLGGKMPRSLRDADLPVGRGFLIRSGQTMLMQTATMELSKNAAEIDRLIEDIIEKHSPYQWYYEINPPPEEEEDETTESDGTSTPANGNANRPKPSEVQTVEDTKALQELESMQKEQAKFSDFKAENLTDVQQNPYYKMLQADKLVKLPIKILESLPMDFNGLQPQDIPSMDPVKLQEMIDQGEIKLPEMGAIPTNIRTIINFYDKISAEVLTQLPVEILQQLPLAFHEGSMPLESIPGAAVADIQRQITEGLIEFTEPVHLKVQKQIRDYLEGEKS
ncbi:MAG: hypothetical protein D6711_18330 [Chloroflexi bacterium]|nr:MAG: hypothetical protein D6711_18330 [Chloroflexota bacterium]